jgi:AMP deaminase
MYSLSTDYVPIQIPSDRTTLSAPELKGLLSSFAQCLRLRDKYMAISLQRLGDNPRDHDGVFKGFAHDIGGVSGVRPDAYAALREASGDKSHPELREEETKFQPWKIYPPPPPPHWHWTDQPTINTSVDGALGYGDEFDFKTCEIPGADTCVYKIDSKGVFQVYGSDTEVEAEGA